MSDMAEGADRTIYKEHQQQASNIIIAVLGDTAVNVIRTGTGSPKDIMGDLNKRYNSKSTTATILKMSELVSMRFANLKDDLSAHIDRMAGLTEQIISMGNELADSLFIGILAAST